MFSARNRLVCQIEKRKVLPHIISLSSSKNCDVCSSIEPKNQFCKMSIDLKASSAGNPSIRRFGDCALVEIIHLHDCLRGALGDLQRDVTELSQVFTTVNLSSASSASSSFSCVDKRARVEKLERKVASRFHLIWSVFRAHSKAEDEFIWPALKEKLNENKSNKPSLSEKSLPQGAQIIADNQNVSESKMSNIIPSIPVEIRSASIGASTSAVHTSPQVVELQNQDKKQPQAIIIEQEEYEEDHADEERMFLEMDSLLSKLREGLYNRKKSDQTSSKISPNTSNSESGKSETPYFIHDTKAAQLHFVKQISQSLKDQTTMLSSHLFEHLAKEENHCIPLVKKHLTHDEINDLVGRIMGKRSSDVMKQILNLAVHNLPEWDRDDMVRHMKEAMVGTFFERWLMMGGFAAEGLKSEEKQSKSHSSESNKSQEEKTSKSLSTIESSSSYSLFERRGNKRKASYSLSDDPPLLCQPVGSSSPSSSSLSSSSSTTDVITSQKELERLIRTIATNRDLSPKQKNTTIQGLRDSVYKNRKKKKFRKLDDSDERKGKGKRTDSVGDLSNNHFIERYVHVMMSKCKSTLLFQVLLIVFFECNFMNSMWEF